MLAPPHCLHASSAVVLADARPAALLASASLAVVLADARPAASFAHAFLAVAKQSPCFASAENNSVCHRFYHRSSDRSEPVESVERMKTTTNASNQCQREERGTESDSESECVRQLVLCRQV
jgi:hypothetical protein